MHFKTIKLILQFIILFAFLAQDSLLRVKDASKLKMMSYWAHNWIKISSNLLVMDNDWSIYKIMCLISLDLKLLKSWSFHFP